MKLLAPVQMKAVVGGGFDAVIDDVSDAVTGRRSKRLEMASAIGEAVAGCALLGVAFALPAGAPNANQISAAFGIAGLALVAKGVVEAVDTYNAYY